MRKILIIVMVSTASMAMRLCAEEMVAEAEVDKLIDRFEDIYWLNIRNAWIELRDMGKPAAPRLIARASDRNEKWRTRYYCMYTLGLIKDARAVPALAEIVANDPDHTLVYFAMDALGEMPDRGAVPAIVGRLKDRNLNVRHRAIYHTVRMKSGLGELEGEEQIIKTLYELCDDYYFDVRLQASDALSRFGRRTSIPGLLKELRSRDGTARKEALRQFYELAKQRPDVPRVEAPAAFASANENEKWKWDKETEEAVEKVASVYETWWKENLSKFSDVYHR